MCAVFSHTSALQYLRTPPQVHMLYEHYPDLDYEQGKRQVVRMAKSGEAPFGAISLPLHLLVSSRTDTYESESFHYHVWSGEITPGLIRDIDYGFSVTSALFTLLNLSSWLTEAQVTMLLYEFMGNFTVYKPTEEIREALQGHIKAGNLATVDGWEPSLNPEGELTDLWKRPPLVAWEEFNRFIERMKGVSGVARLENAAKNVFGCAASPFEVRAAMLLGMTKRRGGQGFKPLELNRRIQLTAQARRISRKKTCTVDLYLGGSKGAPLIIECQGNAFHGGYKKSEEDDNRAMALQSMGYSVLRLRSEQISDEAHLDDTAKCIADLLGKELKPKSKRLKDAERALLEELSINWWNLGEIRRAPRKRK